MSFDLGILSCYNRKKCRKMGKSSMNSNLQEKYLAILQEELVPAMGCTEPIALAYASAKAREILGCEPEYIVAKCSGNMIKNVRCVTIPNSGGMTGIETACILGAIAGHSENKMEVLEKVTEEQRAQTKKLLEQKRCEVEFLDSDIPLHFMVEVSAGADSAMVEIRYSHTNIAKIEKNGETIFIGDENEATGGGLTDRSVLTLENIKQFADEVPLSLVRPMIERQIRYNMDIAYEEIGRAHV